VVLIDVIVALLGSTIYIAPFVILLVVIREHRRSKGSPISMGSSLVKLSNRSIKILIVLAVLMILCFGYYFVGFLF